MNLQRLVEHVRKNGLLLLSDPFLPNVVDLIAGERVKGSWWGHQKGHEIFKEIGLLETHPDVLVTRLVSGKVTYLHRRLWTEFLSVATAREDWQLRGLPQPAKRLLTLVESKGEIDTSKAGAGDAARDLERRLLAYSEEIHTEKGSHTKILMTWSRCPKLRDLKLKLTESERGRKMLEELVDGLNDAHSGKGELPWRRKYTAPKKQK